MASRDRLERMLAFVVYGNIVIVAAAILITVARWMGY